MMHYWWPGGWWFSGFHPILMVIFWVIGIAVIVAVVWIIARAMNAAIGRKPYIGDRQTNRAEEILDERFARGEISEEEYRRMKELLRKR